MWLHVNYYIIIDDFISCFKFMLEIRQLWKPERLSGPTDY